MTENRIRQELMEHEINDNPFDVMLYHSLEMSRDLLFSRHRLRVPVMGEFCVKLQNLDAHIDIIKAEYSKLLTLSDEAIAMCRETSCYYENVSFNKLNMALLDYENNLETLWNRCVPNRNDRFEQLRLGNESSEYQRLLELRKIADDSAEFKRLNHEQLMGLSEMVLWGEDYITRGYITEKEYKRKKAIIDKYTLAYDDIMYIVAYRFKH